MTEAEWLACIEPHSMLLHARDQRHAGILFSGRKMRLFTCGCCRQIWHLLSDPRSRAAVDAAERFADNPQERRQLQDARYGAVSAAKAIAEAAPKQWEYEWAGGEIRHPDRSTVWAAEAAAEIAKSAEESLGACRVLNAVAPCFAIAVLHCIYGNPFQPAAMDRAWLTWNDGAVRKVAQAIYNERAFDRLPLLADALEDAGCTDAAILAHCREPGEHVRGCWVVDLLLGKE